MFFIKLSTMDIINTVKNVPPAAQNGVLAIGNFDGVHRGHRKLLAAARDKADTLGAGLFVLTFEPHPRALFRPDDPPFRISPQPVKMRLLEECGIDAVFSLPFDWDFASQSADHFIDRILCQGIKPVHIFVGDDFRFGQLRKGSPATLRNAGYEVTEITKLTCSSADDEALSSSRIRAALRHGELAKANAMLGWEWYMEGTVIKGDQRGRELGYPTANMALHDTLHPAYGVYAAWVQIAEDGEDSPWLSSATNIGIRPMFEVKVAQVEAHILDFDRDIYGKTLRVKPAAKLRGEAKFDSLDALIDQIAEDCEKARDILTPETAINS